MKAISELPISGAPMLWPLEHAGAPGKGSLLQMPLSGRNLGSEDRSSGGCLLIYSGGERSPDEVSSSNLFRIKFSATTNSLRNTANDLLISMKDHGYSCRLLGKMHRWSLPPT